MIVGGRFKIPRFLVFANTRLSARGGAEPGALPRAVAAQARARSTARARTVLTAAQVLVALVVLQRAQPEPPADPSPLRWFLLGEFLAFRRLAYLTRPASPRR